MSDYTLFVLAGLAVVGAGTVLASAADAVAELTGLGRLWVGAILLAAATSLPELLTGVAAIRIGAPDLAVGDLFGSSMANMLILALLDLVWARRKLLRSVAFEHSLAACLAITTNALAAAFVLAAPATLILGVSPGSLLIVAIYLSGTRAIQRSTAPPPPAAGPPRAAVPVGRLVGPFSAFAIAAAVIAIAAPAFARAAEAIAIDSGLGATFVGTLLLGFATSLPELVACLAAMRIGALDLAVGNLFGSNAFNMATLLAFDLVSPGASIFTMLSPLHALSGLFAVALMALGLAAIVYRAERRFRMIEPDSLAMVMLYAVGVAMLYAAAVPR